MEADGRCSATNFNSRSVGSFERSACVNGKEQARNAVNLGSAVRPSRRAASSQVGLRRAIPASLEAPFCAGAILALFLAAPAHAIVGGAAPSVESIGRSVVTIVGSRGNFCTGTLIAPDLVLSVAHCVGPGATYKIVEYGADRQPKLRNVRKVAGHPDFDMH